MADHLSHARHNEQACKHLLGAEGSFLDWVLTTAFYAAVHYVRHSIFPLERNGHTYVSLVDYCYRTGNSESHSTVNGLVAEEMPDKIAGRYLRLYQLSRTARYNEYQTPVSTCLQAVGDLEKIREYCDPVGQS